MTHVLGSEMSAEPDAPVATNTPPEPAAPKRFKKLWLLVTILLTGLCAAVWFFLQSHTPPPPVLLRTPEVVTEPPVIEPSVVAPPAVVPETAPVASTPVPAPDALKHTLQQLTEFEQRLWQKAPLLLQLRADAQITHAQLWYQKLWWRFRAQFLVIKQTPSVDDTSVEATLKRIETALRQQNATAYAAALSQLRPAERALLEPLPVIKEEKP